MEAGDDLIEQALTGRFVAVLTSSKARPVISDFAKRIARQVSEVTSPPAPTVGAIRGTEAIIVAVTLAALNAFLQINVTGPVLDGLSDVETLLSNLVDIPAKQFRARCLQSLDTDGVAVYPYADGLQLFSLARWLVCEGLPGAADQEGPLKSPTSGLDVESSFALRSTVTLDWLALCVHVWHYKLLVPPSGGHFHRAAQWSDVPSLQATLKDMLRKAEGLALGSGSATTEEKVLFLVEKAAVWSLLGQDKRAHEALKDAAERSGFIYRLAGALGKRTRFQEKSTSQLVVLAKSADGDVAPSLRGERSRADRLQGKELRPEALALNDDTLLETTDFTADEAKDTPGTTEDALPPALQGLQPDSQPQLKPVDQIILLTEAALKDAFSPTDGLTAEEMLPFAARVLADRSTNWQVYTQALLVRSRIEMHRSRTVERGVLQMQVIVDQIVADTTKSAATEPVDEKTGSNDVAALDITQPDLKNANQVAAQNEMTTTPVPSFFLGARPAESAPAHIRLRYVHALNAAPRWHLESELAHAWAGIGSLASALEIFTRLRMWAEVALCLAGGSQDTDADEHRGRIGGGPRARAVLRWRLFRRTGADATSKEEDDDDDLTAHISDLQESCYHGPERIPPPPDAPRLFCILGDLEDSPEHYLRAWDISHNRYARAQRSLGEYHLRRGDLLAAREALRLAVGVNRLNGELWARLGDVCLRMGLFAEAAKAFSTALEREDGEREDARTWSNLGSAFYSMYLEKVKEEKPRKETGDDEAKGQEKNRAENKEGKDARLLQDSRTLLLQSLAAYRRGAHAARDNWRIWDNVITLAARLRPPATDDMLLGLRNVVRIRHSEDALDVDVLRLLTNEAVLSVDTTSDEGGHADVQESPRGSLERETVEFIEKNIVPLITGRSELWEVVVRVRVWRRDFAGALDAAGRAWRAAVGVGGTGAALAVDQGSNHEGGKSWLGDPVAWAVVVDRTEELVALLEKYGQNVEGVGAKWKGKARNAVRSVLGKAREVWEGSEEWKRLERLMKVLQ